MNKILVSLFFIVSLTASAAEIQTITVDEKHIQIGLEKGQVGEFYSINPTLEIEIDTSGYAFPSASNLDSNEPNTIQLIIDGEHQFTVILESGVDKYSLNIDTLIPRFKEFNGFKPGDQFVIAIGFLEIDHVTKEQKFNVQWVGMGNVET
ncbi:MAG: hypothetical protein HRU38_22055 [Saccharospirillaceae bacterium]|nr:hypothetical protein [Pseudomonadales bacterium]NRB81313.1 hypothetical protein [Saccharospirillaceae bacterium]